MWLSTVSIKIMKLSQSLRKAKDEHDILNSTNRKSFERSTGVFSEENIHRGRSMSLTFAISVTIFSLWILYEDISTTQGTAPLCVSVYVTKVTQVSVHVWETRVLLCEWTSRRREKAQESREIFRTPEKCPYNLQAGVENGTCARLFKRTSNTSLRMFECMYACVCVRIVHILSSGQI